MSETFIGVSVTRTNIVKDDNGDLFTCTRIHSNWVGGGTNEEVQ